MSLYTVCTKVPVLVEVIVEDDGTSYVRNVMVDDSMIPGTLETAIADGGVVEDENGLTVKSKYTQGDHDPDWEAIRKAYDGDWPAWEIGV